MQAEADVMLLAWWRALRVLAVLNIGLWLLVLKLGPARGFDASLHLGLSGVYVLVCAYRSVFPRVDLERLVVVDTRLSSIFLGRSAATVAEICFALQLGLIVHQLAGHAGMPAVQKAAWSIPIFMVVAQAFCWHSVLTLNHITQAVESSLWAAGFSWMALLLGVIALGSSGWVQALSLFGMVAAGGFVTYVLRVDVPMYWRRYRQGRAQGLVYMRLHQGARDAWERRVHSGRWEAWKADALWLTPYFSVGVWISIAMACVPGLPETLQR
ncbi:hypothetical protein OU995_13045 [Roseateles sp. SL47]|uniref:hypothetical protein n=1 Tax=Roseateles sp. SL47 TaxID=2995138 RepID=UPI002270A2F7|nr:hypothetical protein [Roseateles sp. SL47]WAC75567.1 hypothetical protein OU995_13045 [Roseateles sp. SL47]